jgi:hypothetical protein
MKSWFKRNYKTIIVSAFLIPIITVALVSISHVTKWYGLSNPFSWAIYLSIGIEIAAMSALAAISADMGKKVYFPFGIVTLIQFIGNVYFAYSFIDVNSESFKSWVELVAPFVEFMGVDPTDFVGHKRFLSFFAGGMLPIISLSFLHMLVRFTQENKERGIDAIIDDGGISEHIQVQKNNSKEEVKEEIPMVDAKDIVGEVSRVRLSEEDLAILERYLNNPPKPNDALVKAAEEYKKQQEPQITDTEDSSDFFPESFVTPEEMDESMVDDVDEIVTITATPTIMSIPSPTSTLTETIEPEEDISVLPEEITPMVVSLVEELVENEKTQLQKLEDYVNPSITPQHASEMMLTTNDDIIKSIPPDDEISDWDITLMDGLEDEPITEDLSDFFPEIYEEPQDIVTPETPNETPTIESEEEKKKLIEFQSQVTSFLNDGLEQVTDTIKNDDLYWESEDNNQEDTLTVELSPRPSPMKKITMRNVGNTQRRKFR